MGASGEHSVARALPWQDNLGSAAGGTYDWRAFQQIKEAPGGFAASGREPIFHYAIFAHYHDRDDPAGSGASGIARGIGGTELLVTLGDFTGGVGSVAEQAGTLMHELGHNLGLRHGGDRDVNVAPGYASVMNYAHQMTGITRGGVRGVLDFSRGADPTLDASLGMPPELVLEGLHRIQACRSPRDEHAGSPARYLQATLSTCVSCETFDDWGAIRLAAGSIGVTRDAHVGRAGSGPAAPTTPGREYEAWGAP